MKRLSVKQLKNKQNESNHQQNSKIWNTQQKLKK